MSGLRWRFQAALNAALASYLHGSDLGRVGRALFPLVRRPRTPVGPVVKTGRDAGVHLDTRQDVPDLLAAAYRALEEVPAPDGAFREFQLAPWDPGRHGRFPPLGRARRRLLAASRDTGVEFFLHGSFASLDFTGYSDLDTLALIPRKTACDGHALRACRCVLVGTWRALKEFDPLQHHGHFVLTEIDLRGYPDPLFPAVIVERGVALAPRARILRARSHPDSDLAAERFLGLARRYLATDLSRGLANAYRLKSDLSVFMLLPALWCQARGRPMDKKRSFGAAYAHLSRGSVAVFRRAAAIRERWRYHEPVWNRWVRRAWFNPLLPAALDAAGARAPAPTVRCLLDPNFFAGTKSAVRELLELFDQHGSSDRTRDTTRDRVA